MFFVASRENSLEHMIAASFSQSLNTLVNSAKTFDIAFRAPSTWLASSVRKLATLSVTCVSTSRLTSAFNLTTFASMLAVSSLRLLFAAFNAAESCVEMESFACCTLVAST